MSVFPPLSPSSEDSSTPATSVDNTAVAAEVPAPPYFVPEGAEVALSAGLVAPSEPACTVCLNCGCERAEEFCPRCGQESTDPVVPLRYLLRDAVDEIFKVDGRIWATMRALLFQPGKTTRDFLDGKRTAYIGPLKLYFAVSTVYFLLFTTFGGVRAIQREAANGAKVGWEASASATQTAATGAGASSSTTGRTSASAPSVSPASPSGTKRPSEKAKILDRLPSRLTEATVWFTEHMSLINLGLLPVYAAQLALLYSRRRRELPFVTHAVFTLYTQSALYVYYLPMIATNLMGSSKWGSFVALVVGGLYSYFALRRAFDDPAGAPRWKTAVRAALWVMGQMFAAMVLGAVGTVIYLFWP